MRHVVAEGRSLRWRDRNSFILVHMRVDSAICEQRDLKDIGGTVSVFTVYSPKTRRLSLVHPTMASMRNNL